MARARLVQRPDLASRYRVPARPVDLWSADLRLALVRSKSLPVVVDDVVESFGWSYTAETPVVSGTVSFIQDGAQALKVSEGDLLLLQSSLGDGRWSEVWRMRMRDGEQPLSSSDSRSFALVEDLVAWEESTDTFHYGKSKKRPKGWLAHEILVDVARRYRLPVGKVVRGRHWITGVSGSMTPMEVVRKAYALERRATGRRYVVQWRRGRLNVVPMARGEDLVSLSSLIEGAVVGREERDEKYANAITVRGAIKGADGKRRRAEVRYVNEKLARQDGLVHKVIDAGGAKTTDEMMARAKRYVAAHGVRKRKLTQVTHPGVATLRRGDVVQLTLPELGFSGPRGLAFVTAGSFTKANGQLDMTIDLTFDDPYVLTKSDQKALNKAARAAKSRKG